MSCRELPIFDSSVQPSNWNERMWAGQYAVHASTQRATSTQRAKGVGLTCAVCDDLLEAEAHARQMIAADPTLRCRIYDHNGFVGAPVREITGPQFKGELDLSPRTRLWVGVGMLVLGLAMCALDWSTEFRLTWPGVVGSRLLIPGLALLVTEALIQLHKHQKALQARKGSPSL